MRDDDELRPVGEAAQELDEAADVRVVEGGLDLVEEIERARPREEEREEEGDRAEGLFAAGEEREPLHTLPGGAQLDLDAGLVPVFSVLLGLSEPESAFAAVYGYEWYARRGPVGPIDDLV